MLISRLDARPVVPPFKKTVLGVIELIGTLAKRFRMPAAASPGGSNPSSKFEALEKEMASKATGPPAKKSKKPVWVPETITFTSLNVSVDESKEKEPVAVIPPVKLTSERSKVTGEAETGRAVSASSVAPRKTASSEESVGH